MGRLMRIKKVLKQISGGGPDIFECAQNKVLQERGTCWFNSNINILVLTPKISTMLVKRMNNILEERTQKTTIKTPITVLSDSTPATSILIYKMLFVVLFTQSRDNLPPDWISELAAKIKSEEFKESTYCTLKEEKGLECALEFSNGGCSFHSLLVLINSILIQGEDYNIIDFSTDVERFLQNSKYYKFVNLDERSIRGKCNQILYKKKLFKKNRGDNQDIFLDSCDPTRWTRDVFFNEFNLNPKNPQFPTIVIVFLHINLLDTSLPEKFYVEDIEYVLEAASLVYEPTNGQGHVIAGLKCETIYYICDSNNNVFECDWTQKSRINNLAFQGNIKSTLHVSIEDVIISINYAIYVKSGQLDNV